MIAWSKFLRLPQVPISSSNIARPGPAVRRLFSYSAAAADRGWRTDNNHRDGSGFRRQQNNYDSNFDRNDYAVGHRGQRGGSNFESRDRSWGNSGDVGSRLNTVNWENEQMRAFKKDLYNEDPRVGNRSDEENTRILQDLKATIKGRDVPKPLTCFDEMEATFGKQIMEELKGTGFSTPSPVQKFAWPIASSGRDSVGVAQTGSGKTLAYLLPALNHVQHQDPLEYGDGPIVLVMGPTRELVSQIQQEAIKFGHLTNIKNAVAYGGEKRHIQASVLRKGAHILIACPGRLLDFVESGVINLKRVTYLVLDEADRMLDMGFEKDIRKIVGQCRPDRQTLMFSATWPTEIQRLARDFCREAPTMVTIGSTELQCNPDIKQDVRVMPELERRDHFFHWLTELNEQNEIAGAKDVANGNSEGEFAIQNAAEKHRSKVLVFTDTKRGADAMQRDLRYRGIEAGAIHGDKEQRERERVLHDFKAGRLQILVATDVAQRGLDIKDVKYVVNYDMPKTIEDYVHRIGRTGRAGATGTAITYFSYDFYAPEKVRMAKALCGAMRDVGQAAPDKLKQIAQQRG